MDEYPPGSAIYADLREKWKHEDDLVNQRVTWTLNSQAFVLAAYGVLAKLRMDSVESKSPDWIVRSLTPFSLGEFFAPIVTLFVLYFLGKGIYAAFRAMEVLKQTLVEHQQAGRVWAGMKIDVLPAATKHGGDAPKQMVWAFAIVWYLLLIYEVLRLQAILK